MKAVFFAAMILSSSGALASLRHGLLAGPHAIQDLHRDGVLLLDHPIESTIARDETCRRSGLLAPQFEESSPSSRVRP
jgi:hypothetical protein